MSFISLYEQQQKKKKKVPEFFYLDFYDSLLCFIYLNYYYIYYYYLYKGRSLLMMIFLNDDDWTQIDADTNVNKQIKHGCSPCRSCLSRVVTAELVHAQVGRFTPELVTLNLKSNVQVNNREKTLTFLWSLTHFLLVFSLLPLHAHTWRTCRVPLPVQLVAQVRVRPGHLHCCASVRPGGGVIVTHIHIHIQMLFYGHNHLK